jgi:hypothetical protein
VLEESCSAHARELMKLYHISLKFPAKLQGWDE